MGAADDVADGVQKVGLAQAGLAVDKERVIVFGRMVGDRDRGGVGELVGRTDNKVLEGVFLVGGQADGFAGLDGCGRLVAVDDSDRDRFAEQLGQRLLQGVVKRDSMISFLNWLAARRTKLILQGDRLGIVEPGRKRDLAEGTFHARQRHFE